MQGRAGAIPGARALCSAGVGPYLVAGLCAGQGWGHTWWQGVLQGRDGVILSGRALCRAGVGSQLVAGGRGGAIPGGRASCRAEMGPGSI